MNGITNYSIFKRKELFGGITAMGERSLCKRKVVSSNLTTSTKNKGNQVKADQLGMSYGKACGILRKQIMFDLVKRVGLDSCFRCGSKIIEEKELSIEHKENWLYSNKSTELFFNLNNIAFSHLKCNVENSRSKQKKDIKHGTRNAYENRGCRCDNCKNSHAENMKKNRDKYGRSDVKK